MQEEADNPAFAACNHRDQDISHCQPDTDASINADDQTLVSEITMYANADIFRGSLYQRLMDVDVDAPTDEEVANLFSSTTSASTAPRPTSVHSRPCPVVPEEGVPKDLGREDTTTSRVVLEAKKRAAFKKPLTFFPPQRTQNLMRSSITRAENATAVSTPNPRQRNQDAGIQQPIVPPATEPASIPLETMVLKLSILSNKRL